MKKRLMSKLSTGFPVISEKLVRGDDNEYIDVRYDGSWRIRQDTQLCPTTWEESVVPKGIGIHVDQYEELMDVISNKLIYLMVHQEVDGGGPVETFSKLIRCDELDKELESDNIVHWDFEFKE